LKHFNGSLWQQVEDAWVVAQGWQHFAARLARSRLRKPPASAVSVAIENIITAARVETARRKVPIFCAPMKIKAG
jgi:hypothetical protein